MSDYTKTTNFTAKDSLSTGDPNKLVKGSDHDTEYDAIETAVNTKLDQYSGATALTTLDDDADVLSVYDDGAGAYKKITVANARVGLKFDNLVSAGLTATQTGVTDNTFVTVEFDDVTTGALLYDKGGDFDIANYCFIAPADGVYLLMVNITNGAVSVEANTIGGLRFEIDTGGGYSTLSTMNYARNFSASGTINSIPQGSIMADLNSGDKVRIAYLNNFGSDVAGEINTQSKFQIARLS